MTSSILISESVILRPFGSQLTLDGEVFELKGFATHYGQHMHSGHYVSVCRTGNRQWFVFNDSAVTKIIPEKDKDVSFEEFFSTVYILVYEKTNERTDSSTRKEVTSTATLEDDDDDELQSVIAEKDARKRDTHQKLEAELDRAVHKNCVIM